MKLTQIYALRLLKISLFLLIFAVTLEIGLQAAGAFLHFKQTAAVLPTSATQPYVILTLGESTTAETSPHLKKSWASQLQLLFMPERTDLLQQNSLRNLRVANEAVVGTTTTALLARLEEMLDRHKPQLVISMMGVNDTSSFWLRDYGLIKQEDGIDWKIPKLVRYVLNYRVINQLNTGQKLNTGIIKAHHFDYPERDKMLKIFQSSMEGSADFTSQEALVETFLGQKSPTEKAQFYVYVAEQIRPDWGNPAEGFSNAYHFYKKAFFQDPQVSDSLDVTLLLSFMLQKNECKKILDYAIEKNIQLTPVTLGRAAVCLANDPDYLNSIYSRVNKDFVYRPGSESPTVKNYQKLYETLRHRKICLIAMEYPLRDFSIAINHLTEKADPDYFFTVSNKENFQEALKKNKYNDLFTDRFAQDFGHLSLAGAQLVARNVYKKIEELRRANQCGLQTSSASAAAAAK